MKDKPAAIEEIVDNVRRLYKAISEFSRKFECETGLTPAKLLALKIVQSKSPMKVSELAKAMYVHPATVVGLLDRLETKGLIQRKRSAEDRRVVYLELTEQGRELVHRAPDVPPKHLLNGLETLSERQLEKVAAGMDQLVQVIGAEEIPPQLLMSPEVNMPEKKDPLK